MIGGAAHERLEGDARAAVRAQADEGSHLKHPRPTSERRAGTTGSGSGRRAGRSHLPAGRRGRSAARSDLVAQAARDAWRRLARRPTCERFSVERRGAQAEWGSAGPPCETRPGRGAGVDAGQTPAGRPCGPVQGRLRRDLPMKVWPLSATPLAKRAEANVPLAVFAWAGLRGGLGVRSSGLWLDGAGLRSYIHFPQRSLRTLWDMTPGFVWCSLRQCRRVETPDEGSR
jgi:hypothetical protein